MEEYSTPTIKQPTFDFSRVQVVKNNHGSTRGDLLDRFLENLNPGRLALGLRPYTHARLAQMLQHLPTDQLYPFLKDCERAKNFGAYFHCSLKPETQKRLAEVSSRK